MKKYNIGFIINSLSSGGAERVLTTLANNFVVDYEVIIITFIATPSFYELDERIKVIPCFETIKPSTSVFNAINGNYQLFKKLNYIVKENNFDLLVGFMTTANVLTTFIGKLNNIPVIISERTNPYHQKITKFWKLLRNFFYRHSDMLIVQNETIRKYFIGKVSENKLKILPNPIGISLSNKRDLKSSSEKKNVVLSVGRLIKSKGYDILIKAFALTNHKDWELWIAGDGPEYDRLNDLVQELGLTHNVKFLGLVKDISYAYNSSKIFAFSSTYEGFPNALIEAMHFGLACVSTDCPTGPSELIENGKNGYLIPVNDLNEMSLKLGLLMKDEILADRFGKESEITTRPYKEENVAYNWKSIIEELMK